MHLSSRFTSSNRELIAMSNRGGVRAVVLGGSLAGLFTARVLADSYDQVTVIDRVLADFRALGIGGASPPR